MQQRLHVGNRAGAADTALRFQLHWSSGFELWMDLGSKVSFQKHLDLSQNCNKLPVDKLQCSRNFQ